jgi:hypothetical protein
VLLISYEADLNEIWVLQLERIAFAADSLASEEHRHAEVAQYLSCPKQMSDQISPE